MRLVINYQDVLAHTKVLPSNSQTRYELSLESTRRPELRARMIEYGSGFRVTAEKMLAAAGASEPRRRGRALVAYVDGLVFDQVVGAGARLDDADLAAACRDVLAMALR